GLPLFSAMQDGATGMVASGMGNAADIYSVDAERSEWLRKIESAKTEVVRKQAGLAAAVSVPPDSSLEVDALPEALPELLSLDSLLDKTTLQLSPAVQLAEQRVREAKASLKLSERSYFTELDVMFAYGYRFPMKVTSSSVSHSGEPLIANSTVKQDAMLSFDVSFPLPLNPRSNQFAMIGEERMMHKSSIESKTAVLLQLKKTILEEHAELERSIQEAKTLRERIIPSRETAYRQSFAGYLNGSITLMQVSELQMKWSMAQMEEAMLRANAWALRGNLLERIGQ
ncbi:MAG: TolC family protein, partial [bacterium]|nr:TolC family protein [bacterium]